MVWNRVPQVSELRSGAQCFLEQYCVLGREDENCVSILHGGVGPLWRASWGMLDTGEDCIGGNFSNGQVFDEAG